MKKLFAFIIALTVPSIALADVSAVLDVEAPTGTLYHQSLSVAPCPVTTDPATTTVSAKCALEQAGLNPEWSSYGDDLFLSSAGGATQDFANNVYWNWWDDLDYGQTALNKHELTDGEHLLIALGVLPLKVEVSSTSPLVGATTTATVSQFSFDASFNPLWVPASGATVHGATTTYTTDASGVADVSIFSADPFSLYAEENGFITSDSLTITPVAQVLDASSTPPDAATSTDPVPPPSSSGGGGSSSKSFDVPLALAYLGAQQHLDGSFGPLYLSDWAALAYASAAAPTAALRAYLQSVTSSFSSVTDYERHAMALEALGINPYSGASIDYIAPIVAAFDGTQIGDAHLDNDDIFALFPLLAAGYDTTDPIIVKTTAFILAHQNPSGDWDSSVDMTAAAVQALAQVDSLSGVSDALAKAEAYLHAAQQSDGGFGNTFSTSWVLQAIAALGDSGTAWHSGVEALANAQQPDGGVGSVTGSAESRTWATLYAIPAVEGDSWPTLLRSFSKPVAIASSSGMNATSTSPIIATSTLPARATSTPLFNLASSSATSTPTLAVTPKLSPVAAPHKTPAKPTAASVIQNQPAAVASAPVSGFWGSVWHAIVAFVTHLL